MRYAVSQSQSDFSQGQTITAAKIMTAFQRPAIIGVRMYSRFESATSKSAALTGVSFRAPRPVPGFVMWRCIDVHRTSQLIDRFSSVPTQFSVIVVIWIAFHDFPLYREKAVSAPHRRLDAPSAVVTQPKSGTGKRLWPSSQALEGACGLSNVAKSSWLFFVSCMENIVSSIVSAGLIIPFFSVRCDE